MPAIRSRLALLLLLAASSLAWIGCDTSGPSFPDGEVFMFPGTIGAEGGQVHIFSLTSSGSVRIELTELTAINPETGDPIANPLLVVGLGRPDAEGVCTTTFTQLMTLSSNFPVFLEVGEFCLATSRPANVPTDTEITYLLTITKLFS